MIIPKLKRVFPQIEFKRLQLNEMHGISVGPGQEKWRVHMWGRDQKMHVTVFGEKFDPILLQIPTRDPEALISVWDEIDLMYNYLLPRSAKVQCWIWDEIGGARYAVIFGLEPVTESPTLDDMRAADPIFNGAMSFGDSP